MGRDHEGTNPKECGLKQSSSQTKRLIYFRGHYAQPRSALITLICKQYETLSTMLSLTDMECATRTLSNLYNLHAVRGNLNSAGELILSSAMSGPHHYFGYLDPYAVHTLHIDPVTRLPHYYRRPDTDLKHAVSDALVGAADVPSQFLTTLLPGEDFTWLSGLALEKQKAEEEDGGDGKAGKSWTSSLFNLSRRDEEESVMVDGVAVQKSRTPSTPGVTKSVGNMWRKDKNRVTDSLFAYPGVLALNLKQSEEEQDHTQDEEGALRLCLLERGCDYDLSRFGAQLVPNDKPFRFDHRALDPHPHAQHKLRLITYNYGENYVSDYLMQGNGVFIERHAFIQCITPLEESCGGFVILGREVTKEDEKPVKKEAGGAVTGAMELVAVTIPLGQTLLVHPYALHGDSFLTGMYAMGMTGNHNAMATADSVFLKHSGTGRNVEVTATPPPAHLLSALTTDDKTACAARAKADQAIDSHEKSITHSTEQIPQLLTSDRLSLAALHQCDSQLKQGIAETIGGGEYSSDDDIREHVTTLAEPFAFARKAIARTRQTLWHPVIFTLKGGSDHSLMGGIKTLGGSLPSPPSPADSKKL